MAYKKTPAKRTSSSSGSPKKNFSRSKSSSYSPDFKNSKFSKRSTDDSTSRPSDKPASSGKFSKPTGDSPSRGPASRPFDKPMRPGSGRPPYAKKSGKSLEAELLKKIFYELKNTSKLSGATVKEVLDYFEPPAKKPVRKPKFTSSGGRSSLTPAGDTTKKAPSRPSFKSNPVKKSATQTSDRPTASKPGAKRKFTPPKRTRP